MNWKLAEAKNKLSEVVSRAITEGPQRIERRNDSVVVVDEALFRQLTGETPSFTEHLLSGPHLDGIQLQRDSSPMREVR